MARKVLWELIDAAKSQVGPFRWLHEGGIELEELAMCLDSGALHPWLKEWKEKIAANRPTASARELHAQWLMCLATKALERMYSPPLTQARARELVAKKAARLFDNPPTAKAIEHWQDRHWPDRQAPLSGAEEQALANAIHRSRASEPGGQDRLIDFFIGIAHMVMTPGVRVEAD